MNIGTISEFDRQGKLHWLLTYGNLFVEDTDIKRLENQGVYSLDIRKSISVKFSKYMRYVPFESTEQFIAGLKEVFGSVDDIDNFNPHPLSIMIVSHYNLNFANAIRAIYF